MKGVIPSQPNLCSLFIVEKKVKPDRVGIEGPRTPGS